METAILTVHVLTAVALVVLVLLQRGKGADAGAAFGGGASQTVFGSSGSGNFMTRMTSVLALIFFVTSFSLAVYAKQRAESGAEPGIPTVQESVPAEESERAGESPGNNDQPPPLE
ncbi:MAG: preprotein translocase subunit SecG [Oleiphilaceae bacterium]|nr:preprotein translocase subunit SecG [Oleiphilaceae bacterium]